MSSVEMEGLWAAKMAQHLKVGCAKSYCLSMILGTMMWKERLLQVVLTSTHTNLSPPPPHQKAFFFFSFLFLFSFFKESKDLCYLKSLEVHRILGKVRGDCRAPELRL